MIRRWPQQCPHERSIHDHCDACEARYAALSAAYGGDWRGRDRAFVTGFLIERAHPVILGPWCRCRRAGCAHIRALLVALCDPTPRNLRVYYEWLP